MRIRAFGVAALLLVFTFFAAAQATEEPNCSAPQFRQFDFWIGDWDLSWPASQSSDMKPGHGSNHISAALDNCVIMENFDGTASIPLRGTSLSTYNRRSHKWQQTWVDNTGAYLDFAGEFNDGEMILTRQAVSPAGKRVLQRMVWKNITPSALDWSWQRSTDNGKNWEVLWPIHYARKPGSKPGKGTS